MKVKQIQIFYDKNSWHGKETGLMCLCCRGRGRGSCGGGSVGALHLQASNVHALVEKSDDFTISLCFLQCRHARAHTHKHKHTLTHTSSVLDSTWADDVTFTFSRMTSFCLLISMCKRTCKYCMRLMVLLWEISVMKRNQKSPCWSILKFLKFTQVITVSQFVSRLTWEFD